MLELDVPIVAAPMAGGPSTPALVDAVAAAGGLGFLAAGYRTPEDLREQVRALHAPRFGVNVFVPGPPAADRAAVQAYREALRPEAARLGVEPGPARWDDDAYDAKVALCAELRVPAVSFTFGCPSPAVVQRLHDAGAAVLVTVTSLPEALAARDTGADAVVAQGAEAGGHAGGWLGGAPTPLDRLLTEVVPVGLPVVAAGGLSSRADVGRVLAAGAVAAQVGTALLLCPEAGTSAVHRAALQDPRFERTVLTRAFTGRAARALENAFIRAHPDAPAGFPELHFVTGPLRRAAAAAGDRDGVHLWAGTGWRDTRAVPAGEVVSGLAPRPATGAG